VREAKAVSAFFVYLGLRSPAWPASRAGFPLDWASEQNPIRFPYRPLGPRRSYDHHVAGTEDLMVAMAAYEAACRQWPGETITLRQGARVIEDSRKEGLV
jgi:hypothetical protein